MDIISFNEAATANGRIEKFINNPDSNSGIVTVPKVIGAGENVTVPAGRVAVLPNVQVDGTLNVEGEVFIPSGAELSTVVQKSGDTMSGNLDFASGTKITGDFSNATPANRTSLQTNVANRSTIVQSLPNGTATASLFLAANNSDPTNAGYGYIGCSAAAVDIVSSSYGTGTTLPMRFFTSGTERVRIDTSGNVGIGTSSPGGRIDVSSADDTAMYFRNSSANIRLRPYVTSYTTSQISALNSAGSAYAPLAIGGSYTVIETNGIERMRIDTSGNVLVTGSGGLGYGTGSGGTVTQLTSKSTTVTLNKPSGQITLNNSALASNTATAFTFYNSTVTTLDQVVVSCNSGYYSVWTTPGSGGCGVWIKNNTAGSLSEAVIINFEVFKGATA